MKYCSLNDAFDTPEWVDAAANEECNYGEDHNDVTSFVDRASGIPSGMSDEQSQFLLYKQLQNKFGMIGPPQHDHHQPQQQVQQKMEPFGTLGMGFAANDIDRLIIILLAGIILLSIIDYGIRK